jgi:hypothetical protein
VYEEAILFFEFASANSAGKLKEERTFIGEPLY